MNISTYRNKSIHGQKQGEFNLKDNDYSRVSLYSTKKKVKETKKEMEFLPQLTHTRGRKALFVVVDFDF